jgi:hypothetical protein
MPYFTRKQDSIDRGGKVAADIACAALLLVYSVVFFGAIGGFVAFLIIYSALVAIDFIVPSSDDDPASVVR